MIVKCNNCNFKKDIGSLDVIGGCECGEYNWSKIVNQLEVVNKIESKKIPYPA